MIENYTIVMKKGKKSLSVYCVGNIIRIQRNQQAFHVIDIDKTKKECYWEECLNKLRNQWVIEKAENLPFFDVSYVPTMKKYKTIHNIVYKVPCMLIPNGEMYMYDCISKKIWENKKVCKYFPKSFLEQFKMFHADVNIVYSKNEYFILPFSYSEYKDILHDTYNMPPFYSCISKVRIVLKEYPHLWQGVRIFNVGDISVSSHTMHSLF